MSDLSGHTAQFECVKQQIASDRVLTHFNPKLPLRLASDASPYGIGAVMSHIMPNGEERPIAFASRTLSAAERNYAQIDKEALAIVWAVRKFHAYLYLRPVKPCPGVPGIQLNADRTVSVTADLLCGAGASPVHKDRGCSADHDQIEDHAHAQRHAWEMLLWLKNGAHGRRARLARARTP